MLVPPRWAKVDGIRLIRREIRETLSPGAIELLFAHSELVVEGSAAVACEAGTLRVYATIMLSVDLSRCSARVREPVDAATTLRLVELMRDCASVRLRLTELARPHLAKLAGLPADSIELELEPAIRCEGMLLLVDGDAVAWPRNPASR